MEQAIVEENGQLDHEHQHNSNNSGTTAVLTSSANIVQLIPSHVSSYCKMLHCKVYEDFLF
jgi:hypothetical protein